MSQDLSEKEIYEEAKQRVKAKKGFYSHLGAYLTVNTILIIVWALSGGATNTYSTFGFQIGNMWFLWPLCIWGAFVLIHFLQVFVFNTSVRGEKEAVEKEVEKIKKGS